MKETILLHLFEMLTVRIQSSYLEAQFVRLTSCLIRSLVHLTAFVPVETQSAWLLSGACRFPASRVPPLMFLKNRM
jgi:hypothetical protein